MHPTFKLSAALLFTEQGQPWRSGIPPMQQVNPVPGMISEDESRYLHWIARNHVSGEGHIVDLGPLAGGSTHALCSGLTINSRAAGRTRVHSYDLWHFFPAWKQFFPGAILSSGDDLHPLFRKNLDAFGSTVVTHPGDLRQHHWTGEPIEILFIDAAKSPDVWQHILREFLPHCVPGRTLLLHQDWVCAECPWIHLTMARLAEYWVPMDSPDGGTVGFLLRRPIPVSQLEDDDLLTQPLSLAIERFERAASWTRGWYGLSVRLAQAHYFVMRGKLKEASSLLNWVLAQSDYGPEVEYDVNLVATALNSRKIQSGFRQRWRNACSNLAHQVLTAMGIRRD